MADATVDLIETSDGTPLEDTLAIKTSETLLIGTLVSTVSTTGRLTKATKLLANKVAGIVTAFPDGSAAGVVGGTVRAKFAWGHVVKLAIITAARTNTSLGKTVLVADNQSVCGEATAGTAALRAPVGTLIKWADADKSTGYVWLRSFAAAVVA